MIDSGIGERILGSRAVATGAPDGDSLENVNTTTLDDGARCYVSGGAGAGEWQYLAGATDTADGVDIVAPVAGGAGRWFKRSSPTASPVETQFFLASFTPGDVVNLARVPMTSLREVGGITIVSDRLHVPVAGWYELSGFCSSITSATFDIAFTSHLSTPAQSRESRIPLGSADGIGSAPIQNLFYITDPVTEEIEVYNSSGNTITTQGGCVLLKKVG